MFLLEILGSYLAINPNAEPDYEMYFLSESLYAQ